MLNKALTLACITFASNAIQLDTTTSGEVNILAQSSDEECINGVMTVMSFDAAGVMSMQEEPCTQASQK